MIRTVQTENGIVRGIEAADPRITSFKGIPFAAPPVGENRWRAPQPAENWEGVKECYRYAPISMQSVPGLGTDIYCREWHVDPEIAMGEDCLYLNVWTGAKSADEKQPVLVWFFGGALQWGYPAEMEFDGERLARRGVIVVTVNYRINCFGFLTHPEITKEAPEAPANFGNLDQQAGLKWVIRNIAGFGGDPENITIAGQSAGGGSVLSQMAAPSSNGLFQKATIMSAMIRSPYADGGIGTPVTLAEGEKEGEEFFAFLGVRTLAEARALDACFVRDKYYEFIRDHRMMMNVIDGKFCVGDPMSLYSRGETADVAVLAGNTADEFLSVLEAKDRTELERKAAELFGDKAESFLTCPETQEQVRGGYGLVSGIECACKSEFLLNRENAKPRENYYYKFDTNIPGWDNPGTFHSVDLWFWFESLAKCWRPFVGSHYDLSRQMCNYWANFIKTGNPNGQDADGSEMPYWAPYCAEHRTNMVFGKEGAYTVTEEESTFMSLCIERTGERLRAL